MSLTEKIIYSHLSSRNVTFKAGMGVPIHRWFRFTPSYSPDLVQKMLMDMNCSRGDVVLDPFSGAGTTLIECQLRGIKGFGFEINPFLHFVGKTSLYWNLDAQCLEYTLKIINHRYSELNSMYHVDDLENGNLLVPPIHNPFRWWRKDILKESLCLKLAIQQENLPNEIRDFFMMAIACILVPDLTNVTLGKLQLHFINRDDDLIDVWNIFSKQVEMMITDIKHVNASYGRLCSLYHADSTGKELPFPEIKANIVVTSPPYPNRYSYVWNTRPHLYFLDLFGSSNQSSELDKKTIGGTWGAATSSLIKGMVIPDNDAIDEVIVPVANQIRKTDNLMANYLLNYFNMLSRQITAMDWVLQPNVRLAYVVGCSELKGTYVETDVLLAQVMEKIKLGFNIRAVERFRKRNSGKDLFESIVYAER